MFKKFSSFADNLSTRAAGWIASLNLLLLGLLPGKVLAVLPAANDVADGASTTSPIQMFRDFGSRGVTIGATVIGAVVVLGVGYAIYSAFTEAREKDNWKQFGITASAGVVVAAGTVIMAILAVNYAA